MFKYNNVYVIISGVGFSLFQYINEQPLTCSCIPTLILLGDYTRMTHFLLFINVQASLAIRISASFPSLFKSVNVDSDSVIYRDQLFVFIGNVAVPISNIPAIVTG